MTVHCILTVLRGKREKTILLSEENFDKLSREIVSDPLRKLLPLKSSLFQKFRFKEILSSFAFSNF